MGIRRIKTEQGMPIEDFTNLKPGTDPTAAINRLYSAGRRTYGQPMPDTPREATPKYQPPKPSWTSERATYAIGRNSAVSPAPDESQVQFSDDKVATHNDASGWVRGQGNQAPHPKFDSGPSGSRYDRRK
jgi:hypothetical protein